MNMTDFEATMFWDADNRLLDYNNRIYGQLYKSYDTFFFRECDVPHFTTEEAAKAHALKCIKSQHS
jgi:hypothetical protein